MQHLVGHGEIADERVAVGPWVALVQRYTPWPENISELSVVPTAQVL